MPLAVDIPGYIKDNKYYRVSEAFEHTTFGRLGFSTRRSKDEFETEILKLQRTRAFRIDIKNRGNM